MFATRKYFKFKHNYYRNSCCYKRILLLFTIFYCNIVSASRGTITTNHMSSSAISNHHNNINNNYNSLNIITNNNNNDGNTQTNSIQRRNSNASYNTYTSSNTNINNINNSNNNNNNNNNNNIMMIGLSSCQTVCACKWKGGKQTVECIDHALITIPENIDPSTQVLDMSGNNLQILPREQFIRENLLNLQKLFLRNCRLGQIDGEAFKGLTNLVELDLSHNLLTSIPSFTFSYIPSLRDLTLASNPIQKIESHAFKHTPSLTKLDLSHCDIQMIAPQAFEGLDSLHSLKLNGNKLSELRPRTVETLSRLHGVELHDNPWMCDCRLRAAKIWLTENNIPYPVAPICSGGPERVIDRTFAELHVDEFACRPEMLPVNRYIESTMGDNATIICRSSAIPSANINWYWNGRLLVNSSAFSSYQKVYIYEDGQFEKRSRLVLTNSQETDSSEFYCVADNRAGTAEANFTLHVTMRAAGMASLNSGQIVGLSAALVILILFILLTTLFLLVRLRRTPFIESKTPNHLEVITTVNQQNSINCKQSAVVNNVGTGGGGGGGGVGMMTGNSGVANNIDNSTIERKNSAHIMHNNDSKLANPVQKPPRLTDLSYTTSHYDGNGSILSAASCFISPTASAGNNPDLINDTKRFGSSDFADLKIPAVLTAPTKDCIDQAALASINNCIERPGSGEYSRAGGCDSLYPSGLWESSSASSTSQHHNNNNHHNPNHHHNHHPADDIYLKRATSTTIPGYSYTDKTPIIDNTQLYDIHDKTNDYFSKTFPRTHFGTLTSSSASSTAATSSSAATILSSLSSSGPVTAAASTSSSSSTTTPAASQQHGGYPSDYGLPLVPGAEQQIHHTTSLIPSSTNHMHHPHPLHHHHQINSNTSSSNNNNNSKLGSSLNSTVPSMLPNGMPVNAKTIRVWQKGGVPVLPPVTALKRALTSSSRNSPDEGYQEGCGTDV